MKKKEAEKQEEYPEEKETKEINFLDLLNNPLVGNLVGSAKDIFKKEKADPNVCEISIKAPSDVILKLFKVEEVDGLRPR